MEERLGAARNGEPYLSVNGVFVHSRYDPSAEADRFLASIHFSQSITTFLCIEPGLGYLLRSAAVRYPHIRTLAVHCSSFAVSASITQTESIPAWSPGTEDLRIFLERHIEDAEAARVKIIEWRPSVHAYGDAASDLYDRCASFLKRAAANARTSASFGLRWFKNAVRFASSVETTISVCPGTAPVIVCASGPSLEAAIPALETCRKEKPFCIVAVSSAAATLIRRGIVPDLSVATDGGGWATFHLFEPIRSRGGIAASLTAAVPSRAFTTPLLPICDGSAWQRILCDAGNLNYLQTPQRGTVSATALDIARGLTTGPLYLAGFDLGVKDEKTHAAPNALDRFVYDRENRFFTATGALYDRYLAARDGGALDIYAAWFIEHVHSINRTLLLLRSDSPLRNLLRMVDWVENVEGSVLPIFESRIVPKRPRETLIPLIDALQVENISSLTIESVKKSVGGELISLMFPLDYADLLAKIRRGESAPRDYLILRERLISSLSSEQMRYNDE